jgi:two-component system cell cycle response regulator DivK
MERILLVEDMPDNAELTLKILASAGYEICHATDAETGFQQALECSPQLILLDLGLPDYDGQTLAGWLRADAKTANIPIIVLTAWPEETARSMVKSYGCDGYIGKPIIRVKEFLEQVSAFLKS